MVELLAVSVILTTWVITFIKEQREFWMYKKCWIPLCILSILFMLYGRYFSEETMSKSYVLQEVSSVTQVIGNKNITTTEEVCNELEFSHKNLNLFLVSDMVARNFVARSSLEVDINLCEEKQ